MRCLIFLVFNVMSVASLAQKNAQNSVMLSYLPTREIMQTDSFSFCSIKYGIPKDCETKTQINCCNYFPGSSMDSPGSDPQQLSCIGGTLMWKYFADEKSRKEDFAKMIANFKKINHQIKAIFCYLHGTKVEGIKMHIDPENGLKYYIIITQGKVNGQNVLVELMTYTELQNNQIIHPTLQQILKL